MIFYFSINGSIFSIVSFESISTIGTNSSNSPISSDVFGFLGFKSARFSCLFMVDSENFVMDKRAKFVPDNWALVISEYRSYGLSAALSVNTLRTRCEHLKMLARQVQPLGPFDLQLNDLLIWAGQKAWSRAYRRSVYNTLRSFYRWAVLLGYIDVSPAKALPKVVEVPGIPRPVPEDFYKTTLTNVANTREYWILKLAGDLGLRRGEIAKVHVSEIVKSFDGYALIVRGKGSKTRMIPLSSSFASRLKKACNRGYLFPSKNGHLTPSAVGKLATAALDYKYSLHQLRHRFATVVVDSSNDLLSARMLLGHSSVSTTQRYVLRPSSACRAAALAAQTSI